MTRQRKYDYDLIKREYIHDAGQPPISYTDLAEKYGMSRSLLTDRGAREGWTEEREAFRTALGIKTTEAMTDEIVKFQIALRERQISVGLKYLAKYEEALDAGEIKVSTRDMVAIAGMVRVHVMDAAASRQPGEEELLDENTPLHPDQLRNAIRLLEEGDLNGAEPGDAAEEPSPTARPN